MAKSFLSALVPRSHPDSSGLSSVFPLSSSSLSGLADTSLAPEIQAVPISAVSVEFAFRLPLHALAASFLANFSDNSMRLLVLVAFLRRLTAPFLVLILTNSHSFALLAPVRQTVSPAAVLTELTLFLGLLTFWTLLHFDDPHIWSSPLSTDSVPLLISNLIYFSGGVDDFWGLCCEVA